MIPSFVVAWVLVRLITPLIGMGGRSFSDIEITEIVEAVNESLAAYEPAYAEGESNEGDEEDEEDDDEEDEEYEQEYDEDEEE